MVLTSVRTEFILNCARDSFQSFSHTFPNFPTTREPILNPYALGAGSPPPELAGRGDVREAVRICIERLRRGRHAKSVLMVGLRGVGKTVLLDQMRHDAEASGAHTVVR
ncbi:ATP-binding protein [Cupriavidus necator]|uniref:ATP-binding protein n=1 Tax=Cupriavidus necator TaxID=106590 RepID=UPI00129D3C22|nr:ATP-binding protein [Cupriavidus necator]